MPQKRLNPDLLDKVAKKSGKSQQYLREQISRMAGRQGISSTAAQLAWARDLGIGIANALNKAPADVRSEVQALAKGSARPVPRPDLGRRLAPAGRRAEPINSATIRALLHDGQLHSRCRDLLQRKRHFDRAFREAATALDGRLKPKAGIKNMNPENLVGKAINPDPAKAVIEVSSSRTEQEGIYSVCKGIMLAFRNPAHHSLSDKFTREDALKFCGFVDAILAVLDQATVHTDRI